MYFIASKDKPKLEKNQNTKSIGDYAEQLAQNYLTQRGLKLVSKQYKCRFGECDLIMKEGRELVFIEVRYKRQTQFCTPEETIHLSKQRRLIKTAEHFMLRYPTFDCRMDVIAITGNQPNFKITWIPDAFGVQ